jgi:hypothetical protein
MSEHYNMVVAIAQEAYNVKMKSPAVQKEVARVRQAIEEAAAGAEFKCEVPVKISGKGARFVRAILENEGYQVPDSKFGVYLIFWDK